MDVDDLGFDAPCFEDPGFDDPGLGEPGFGGPVIGAGDSGTSDSSPSEVDVRDLDVAGPADPDVVLATAGWLFAGADRPGVNPFPAAPSGLPPPRPA